MPVTLEPLLPHLPAWALVLTRLSALFILAPVFGSTAVPLRLKALMALVLSFCVYPVLLTPGSAAAANVLPVVHEGLKLWTLVPAVASELIIGLILGLGVGMPLLGMQMAGRIIDQQIGLGIGGVFNPEMGVETGILGEFFYITAIAVFVILGGHRVLLATLVGSFSRIPLGGYMPDGHVTSLLLGMTTSMFELGLRVSAPLLCLVFVETVAMGFIARTVPQMNILSIGFALRILAGSALLVGAISIDWQVGRHAMEDGLRTMQWFLTLGGRAAWNVGTGS
ncbi:MAG: flagellar biosynthetic protein FliR [Phycisphaeraceae bacterium]|nr:flagellar biosynthetic protein FliR [Phycisphaeraceae bacterium]